MLISLKLYIGHILYVFVYDPIEAIHPADDGSVISVVNERIEGERDAFPESADEGRKSRDILLLLIEIGALVASIVEIFTKHVFDTLP